MEVIDENEFTERLKGLRKKQFVSVTALTVPEMRTKGNPLAGRVRKIVYCSGAINGREKERRNRRSWGVYLEDSPLVEHAGADGVSRLYLDISVQHRIDAFCNTETGRRIPPRLVAPWLRAPERGRPKECRRSIRDFRCDRIAEFRINGQLWRIVPLWPELSRFLLLKDRSRVTR